MEKGSDRVMAADALIDRRRLRRQVTFWRVAAALALFALVLGLGYSEFGGRVTEGRDHIARVRLDGMILGAESFQELLTRVENSSAKAVVLRIQSGGGTTSGSEAIFEAVRKLSEKKPVAAVIDGIGASGAYMAAIGTDRIFAGRSAIVGSIGVIAQFPNVEKLLDTLGVRVESFRSSPLKALPNGIEETPPAARAALESIVRDTYLWFRNLVGERRGLSGAALDEVADGRVFTGQQALGLRLIDAIGGEREAVRWFEQEKSIAENLPIRTYEPARRLEGWTGLDVLIRFLAGIGIDARLLAQFGIGGEMLRQSTLDGLLSLWRPSSD